MEKSIFADIIQANTKEIPTLTIKSEWHGGNWDFPNPAEEARDTALEGFVMVGEGAFAALPLSSSLDSTVNEDSWLFSRAAAAPPILKRLSELVYAYPTEDLQGGLRRYLFNAKNTTCSMAPEDNAPKGLVGTTWEKNCASGLVPCT